MLKFRFGRSFYRQAAPPVSSCCGHRRCREKVGGVHTPLGVTRLELRNEARNPVVVVVVGHHWKSGSVRPDLQCRPMPGTIHCTRQGGGSFARLRMGSALWLHWMGWGRFWVLVDPRSFRTLYACATRGSAFSKRSLINLCLFFSVSPLFSRIMYFSTILSTSTGSI